MRAADGVFAPVSGSLSEAAIAGIAPASRLLGNRAEDQRMPAGDAMRGDHDQVDIFAIRPPS